VWRPCQRLLQSAPALLDITARPPEIAQGRRQAQRELVLAPRRQPIEGDAQVIVLLLQAEEPGALPRPHQLRRGALRQAQDVQRMGTPGRIGLALVRQLLQRVVPHALQQTIADPLHAPILHRDQTLVDQRGQAVERLRPTPALSLSVLSADHGDGLRGVQPKASHEDAQLAKERLLLRGEEVVAPADR